MFDIIDLSQQLTNKSLSYPGTVPAWISHRRDLPYDKATLSRFSDFDPHGGTHMDAPLHFALHGIDIGSVPLRLYPVRVVSVDTPCIEMDDVPTDCAACAVLFSTGWERHAGTPGYYEAFPYLTNAAARCLVERKAGLVGLDTPSVDGTTVEDPPYPAHVALCGAGIPIVEGLIHLQRLLPLQGEILFAAFPLNLGGIEASPVRAVALVPRS